MSYFNKSFFILLSVQDVKLADLNIPISSIKPGSKPPINLVDGGDDGISIVLHFGKEQPREHVTAIVVTIISKMPDPISDLELKAVVPKGIIRILIVYKLVSIHKHLLLFDYAYTCILINLQAARSNFNLHRQENYLHIIRLYLLQLLRRLCLLPTPNNSKISP